MEEICLENIFDSHCHYDDAAFDEDRDELLCSLMSDKSQVSYLMHACVDFKSAEFGLKTAEKFERFYTSVGIHPENLYDAKEDFISRLEKLCENKKVKAIGEVGLDYHYEGFDKERQISVLEAQLELANSLDLPVIMHCRDAHDDFLRLMKKHRPKGVVHCFSGSAELAREYLKLGLYIGFTGALTFKNAKKAKLAFAEVPTDRLLFETDCPYMAPVPFRGKRCDSRMIAQVALCAQELSGVSAQELVDRTNQNAKELFGI